MKPLPLPLRVAAGLAVTTAERARELPGQLAGLPVTVVSQVLQASMRLQQHVTELAIKGDEALSSLRPVEDTPSWATFDEDLEADFSAPSEPDDSFDNVTPINGEVFEPTPAEPAPAEPSTLSTSVEDNPAVPAGIDNYDELTLPQLRARLRRLDLGQLEELLEYERANANRGSFVGMLSRRISNVRAADEAEQHTQ